MGYWHQSLRGLTSQHWVIKTIEFDVFLQCFDTVG